MIVLQFNMFSNILLKSFQRLSASPAPIDRFHPWLDGVFYHAPLSLPSPRTPGTFLFTYLCHFPKSRTPVTFFHRAPLLLSFITHSSRFPLPRTPVTFLHHAPLSISFTTHPFHLYWPCISCCDAHRSNSLYIITIVLSYYNIPGTKPLMLVCVQARTLILAYL